MKLIANEVVFSFSHQEETVLIILKGTLANTLLTDFWRQSMSELDKVRAIMSFLGASDDKVKKEEVGSTVILSPVTG